MGAIAGQGAKLQIGKESAWGTGVTPTVALDFTSENLRFIPNYIEEDTLVGGKTTRRYDNEGEKIEGGFDVICHPDNIGLLLAAALGTEASPSGVGATSTIYDHSFTPMERVSASSLIKLSVYVDRKVEQFRYVSWKCNTVEFEAAQQDYLRARFDGRGYDEETGASSAALSPSSVEPFRFSHGAVTVDGTNYDDIVDFRMRINNNLEDDLFTMNGSTNMQEIEPQKLEVELDIEVLYADANNTNRTNDFKAGTTVAVIATFTNDAIAGESEAYVLKFDLPLCYILEADPMVSGPDRIRQRMRLRATEDDSNEALTIVLRDATATKHSA